MTLDALPGRSSARLAAALVGALLLAAIPSLPARAAAAPTVPTASATAVSGATAAPATSGAERHAEALGVRLVDEARSRAGLPPLRSAADVEAVARARAVDMRDRGYFAHATPDGTDVFDILDRSGIAWSAGSEAIGWNTVGDADASATRVVEDWLASPEHRDILLARDRDAIGLASALDEATGRRTWVAVLVAAPPPIPPKVSVRVLRVGRPDAAGTRVVTVAWSPRAAAAARSASVLAVAVQARPVGGRWTTAVATTTRTTLRLRVRSAGAFEIRIRARGPGGQAGPWSVVRIRP